LKDPYDFFTNFLGPPYTQTRLIEDWHNIQPDLREGSNPRAL